MLNRKLIAIAIVTLGLGLTSAFGQGRPPVSKKDKPKRSDAIIKPIHAEVNEIMIDGTKVWGNEVTITGGPNRNQSQTSRASKQQNQNKLGNVEVQGISETNKILDVIKSPRKTASGQATGKRQHLPVKNKNLGDTGTHEVGHKQRKRRN